MSRAAVSTPWASQSRRNWAHHATRADSSVTLTVTGSPVEPDVDSSQVAPCSLPIASDHKADPAAWTSARLSGGISPQRSQAIDPSRRNRGASLLVSR